MSENQFSYIPGSIQGYDLPLENFIPPLPKRTFPSWVEKMGYSNHLLIDPISANPMLPVELADSGYRVLSARSNPIIWLITEVIASAPTKEKFSTVLNKLLNTRHGKSILFDHLQDLYSTPCHNCGKLIQPDGFIWEKGKDRPISKIYKCKFCADQGEKDISNHDLENLDKLGDLGIHRSRAFQRVVFGGEYEQASLRSALDCYLPRALYVCMMLTNKLEGLPFDKKQSKFIRALLLSVFNDAHSLKHWPPRNYRFLQLSVPTKFFERNLFLSLQTASRRWMQINTPVRVSYWPNLPKKGGGICFYQRKLSEKKEFIPKNTSAAVTTIFPHPGQAFWTFSALWSGWLWGRKAVNPMRSALGRRKYDWYWFTKAVHLALNRIAPALQINTKALGIFPQYTPNLGFGLFTGMHTVGFNLEGAAFRASEKILQCQWEKRPVADAIIQSECNHREVFEQYLSARGEPADYHRIIMQTIIECVKGNGIPSDISAVKDSDFSRLQNLVKKLLGDTNFLIPYSSDLPGGSRWWLQNEKNVQQPISEKIEADIHQSLLSKEEIHLEDLDRDICHKYTDEQTPETELVRTILQSYADPRPTEPLRYRIRSNESTSIREKDLEENKELLIQVGESFNLNTKANSVIYWIDPATKSNSYVFYPTISTEISQIIYKHAPFGNAQHVIVFPGSRSSWLYYRLRHDPRFAAAVENGWHFLKFRYLRRLVKKDDLDLQAWIELLDSDPPLWDPPTQLQFL